MGCTQFAGWPCKPRLRIETVVEEMIRLECADVGAACDHARYAALVEWQLQEIDSVVDRWTAWRQGKCCGRPTVVPQREELRIGGDRVRQDVAAASGCHDQIVGSGNRDARAGSGNVGLRRAGHVPGDNRTFQIQVAAGYAGRQTILVSRRGSRRGGVVESDRAVVDSGPIVGIDTANCVVGNVAGDRAVDDVTGIACIDAAGQVRIVERDRGTVAAEEPGRNCAVSLRSVIAQPAIDEVNTVRPDAAAKAVVARRGSAEADRAVDECDVAVSGENRATHGERVWRGAVAGGNRAGIQRYVRRRVDAPAALIIGVGILVVTIRDGQVVDRQGIGRGAGVRQGAKLTAGFDRQLFPSRAIERDIAESAVERRVQRDLAALKIRQIYGVAAGRTEIGLSQCAVDDSTYGRQGVVARRHQMRTRRDRCGRRRGKDQRHSCREWTQAQSIESCRGSGRQSPYRSLNQSRPTHGNETGFIMEVTERTRVTRWTSCRFASGGHAAPFGVRVCDRR